MTSSKRKSEMDAHWRDRFRRARTDPVEARALLTLFAALASDARDAEPALVQWVAKRVLRWAHRDFRRDDAQRAFDVTLSDGAPKSGRAAEKRATAVAAAHWLHNIGGATLNDAFTEAGVIVGLADDTVRAEFGRFRTQWRDGVGSPAEWMPIILLLKSWLPNDAHADAWLHTALQDPRRGRPRGAKSR